MYQDWMDKVKIGSILQTRGGQYRIVRSVSHYKRPPNKGKLRCVYFAIKRCSWTHRPYTIMSYNDLYQNGYSITSMTYKFGAKIDAKLAQEIADHELRSMSCCDVKGVY